MIGARSPGVEKLAEHIVAVSQQRRTVVALDGPVAVGKSTLAAQLARRLETLGVRTCVVGADGFLLPMTKLQAQGLIARKGFPESFDRPAMLAFLAAFLCGDGPGFPTYAHDLYDVSPDSRMNTDGAAVVLFEGVNVLASDLTQFYDFTLYLDADLNDLETWFTARFMATPFSSARAEALAPWRPASGDLARWAAAVWREVNVRNLVEHISKGRDRADIVLVAHSDHGLD